MLRDKLRKIPIIAYIVVAVVLVTATVLTVVLSTGSKYIQRNNTITLLYDHAYDETIMMYNNEVMWDDDCYVADYIKLYDVCLTGDAIVAYNTSNGVLYYFNHEGQKAISDDITNFVLSDDGSTIAWVSNAGKVQLFNGVSVRDINDNGSGVNFAISPNGKLLLYVEATDSTGVMKLYDTSSRKSVSIAAGMYPLSINNDGSIIYCLDSSERLWCYDRDGNVLNSYMVLGENAVHTNINHDQIMFYDANKVTYVVKKSGEPYRIGFNATQIVLPDTTPVSYNVTTSKSYYVFVDGVKDFAGCVYIDGETDLNYVDNNFNIRNIDRDVQGVSMSDNGKTMYYVAGGNLYRATGKFKSSTYIESGVASVYITPNGKAAYFLTAENELRCFGDGGIRSLAKNCGYVTTTPKNGAMYMLEYDEEAFKGKLYFTADGVTSYLLSDKAYDCWITTAGAYYTEGHLKQESGEIDYDVNLYGSDGGGNFEPLYGDVWDIYNYNYSY